MRVPDRGRLNGGLRAIAMMALLGSSFGQAELPVKGAIRDGSVLVRCFATTCQFTIPVVETVTLAGSRVRVVPGHPGGTFVLRVTTDAASYEGEYAVCGRETVVDLLPASLKQMGEPCPASGVLHVDPLPPGTRLWLDGEAVVAGADGTVNTYAGGRELRIELDGFEPYIGSFAVGDRERVEVRPDFAALPGVLLLQTPTEGVSVAVDDEVWVEDGDVVTEESAVLDREARTVRLRLTPGLRTLRITRSLHVPVEFTMEVAPGSFERRALALVPLPGTVTFRASPEHATLVVDDLGVEAGVSLELAPGVVHVVATAPGYERLESMLEVLSGEEATVEIELRIAPVRVRLVGPPPGALLELESGEVVDANIEFWEMPGSRRLRVTADGYAPRQLEVHLEIGAAAHIEARMQRLATLTVVTSPTAAVVTIGGTERRERRIELAAGTYFVKVSAVGHEPWEELIRLADGDARFIEVRLSPLPSWLLVSDLPAATRVTINGVSWDVADGRVGPLAPGRHVLELEGPAHQPLTRSLWIEPGQHVDLRGLAFVWRSALIELLNLPPVARVKVGERDVVRYTGPFEVSSGRHVIWVAADGVGRVQLTIDVGPGERLAIPVTFE